MAFYYDIDRGRYVFIVHLTNYTNNAYSMCPLTFDQF